MLALLLAFSLLAPASRAAERVAPPPPPSPAAIGRLLEKAAALRAQDAAADPGALSAASAELETLRSEIASLPADLRQPVLDEARALRDDAARRRLERYEAQAREAGFGRGDWDEVGRLAVEAAPPEPLRDAMEDLLADRAAAERGGRRAAVARRWREELAATADARRFVLRRMTGDRRLPPEDARRLRALAAYVPGLDAASAVGGHWAFELAQPHGGAAAGWALQTPEAALTANRMPSGTFDWFYVAVHEALHQADGGYARGRAALRLLLGARDGDGLAMALIEGYTELRTWRALARLLRDSRASDAPLARAFDAAVGQELFAFAAVFGDAGPDLEARMLKSLSGSYDELLERWVPAPYAPYVRLIEGLLALPGGEAAVGAFAARGEVGPLAALVGRERLEAAGAVAGLHADLDGRGWRPGTELDARAVAAGKSGLTAWLRAEIGEALLGALDAASAASLVRAAEAVARELVRLRERRPDRWVDYAAFRHVDLDAYRTVDDSALPERLAADYERAARERLQRYNDL